MTSESSRNVTHFICAAVESPAVWGAIDLTSYYRRAEAGGGRQEHDTDNSWRSLFLFHFFTVSPHISRWPLSLTLSLFSHLSHFTSVFPLTFGLLLYLCLQALTFALPISLSLSLSLNLQHRESFSFHLSHCLPFSPPAIFSFHPHCSLYNCFLLFSLSLNYSIHLSQPPQLHLYHSTLAFVS